MELRIKPASNNKYVNRALLIKGAAPALWLRELDALNIDVRDIEAFAIPSDKANVLYGCLLIFNKELPKDTRSHKRFQCAYDRIFIPENAELYPQLTAADITSIRSAWIIAHPDFGFVDLEEPVNWLELLSEVPVADRQLRQPLEGIAVPDKILSFSVEMDEEELENSLLPQKTEEEWIKDLPFNLQKVLNGNKKEAEKYLKYLAQYPERALALGIPLDVMSTSRDSGWGSFNFRSGWMQSLFGRSGSGGSGNDEGSFGSGRRGPLTGGQYIKSILIGIAIFFLLAKLLNSGEEHATSQNYTSSQVEALNKQYKELLTAPPKEEVGQQERKDSLAQEGAALRSKYLAAVYKYGSREVQFDKQLKDSVRLKMDELKQWMNAVNLKIAARNATIRKTNMQKVEAELTAAEKKLSHLVKDSIDRLPGRDLPGSGAGNILYQSVLKDKMTHLRDSLEKEYGLSPKDADVITPAQNPVPAADYEVPEKPGIFSRLMLLLSGLLISVFIFTKVIRGKTISMGGYGVPAGVKVFLLLIFIGMLAYILYPLIDRYGYNWFVWLILFAVAALTYRLLASDKTILKSDKDG